VCTRSPAENIKKQVYDLHLLTKLFPFYNHAFAHEGGHSMRDVERVISAARLENYIGQAQATEQNGK